MRIRGALSRDAIATFLETQTIPIRLGCRTPTGHPWMVSLWYRYRAADDGWVLECATSASADVVASLRETPEISFEVSTNDPPYAGVRGRGEASIEPAPEKAVLRDLLERYLGGNRLGARPDATARGPRGGDDHARACGRLRLGLLRSHVGAGPVGAHPRRPRPAQRSAARSYRIGNDSTP